MNEGVPKTPANEQEKSKTETPQFIKEFSRGNSQEERDALATEIRGKRRERDGWRKEYTELTLEQERVVAELNELALRIEEYNSDSFLQKITGYLKYRELQARLAERQGALGSVESSQRAMEQTPPQFEEPKKILEDFYMGEEKRWAEAGYTKEDIQKHFSEENLSRLSLDEYALLMRRFPGEMVTHVTRQGVRDHSNSIWHTAGKGAVFNGFKDIIENKQLSSSVAIAIREHGKEGAVAQYLHLDDCATREDALEMLTYSFDWNLASNNAYADIASIHFASEHVMDGMYGGERGNEIFFVFPSAFVASQLRYGGKGSIVDDRLDAHNDKWVYPNTDQGISIDVGLTFIPQNAQVDPRTGSRYKLNSESEPVQDLESRTLLRRVILSSELALHLDEIIDITGKIPERWDEERVSGYYRESLLKLKTYQQLLEEHFQITDRRMQCAILNYKTLTSLAYDDIDTVLDSALERAGLLFLKADETIPSEVYWEKFFQKNPNMRPSKIVYYSEKTPTQALNAWRSRNRITKRAQVPDLGFPENIQDASSEGANMGRSDFIEIAQKIIDDRFPEIPKPELGDSEEL